MREITIKKSPNAIIESHYGTITYGEFCRREVERLNDELPNFRHKIRRSNGGIEGNVVCIVKMDRER